MPKECTASELAGAKQVWRWRWCWCSHKPITFHFHLIVVCVSLLRDRGLFLCSNVKNCTFTKDLTLYICTTAKKAVYLYYKNNRYDNNRKNISRRTSFKKFRKR